MDKQYWSGRIRGLEPYTPGEQPRDRRYIKLNTNENPYPPGERVLQAARAAADGQLRLYPDPNATQLKAAIARRNGLEASQVFVGNGSDEVLAFCFAAFLDEDTCAVFPDVTYSFYPVYARLFGVPTRVVPLEADFTMPLSELSQNSGVVFLANPNAPTGIALPRVEIEALLIANPDHLVIVDEAYVDFGAESAVPLIDRYDNLLVVQTFSKSRSLAGLRIGFAMGSENLIAALETVKNSFNSYTLDRVALAAGEAAILDEPGFAAHCRQIIATREWVIPALARLGFEVLPSQANFVFAGHPHARALYEELRRRGILVRHFPQPRTENFLRISIGTDEQMRALLRELEDLAAHV